MARAVQAFGGELIYEQSPHAQRVTTASSYYCRHLPLQHSAFAQEPVTTSDRTALGSQPYRES